MKLENDPDYVPSIFVYSDKTSSSTSSSVSRCKRLMQRRERQYHAKRQKDGATKQTTTSTPPVTEQTDQPEVMNTEPEEESDKENDDPQRAASVGQQVLATEDNSTDQPKSTCLNCDDLLQKMEVMEQTILSQQELIANLSFLLGVNQQHHAITESNASSILQAQMQTITLQENFISRLQASLKEATLSPAARLTNDDEQTQYFTGLSSYALFAYL